MDNIGGQMLPRNANQVAGVIQTDAITGDRASVHVKGNDKTNGTSVAESMTPTLKEPEVP